jgi:hypothetical protein
MDEESGDEVKAGFGLGQNKALIEDEPLDVCFPRLLDA